MFNKLIRKIAPNPLDRMLVKARKRGAKKVLLGWNRGLGDIALGLYAIVLRIRQYLDKPEITFVIRENLKEGFSMLAGVKVIVAPHWQRGKPYDIEKTLNELKIDHNAYDLIIDYPNPTYWVSWQRGKVIPKLRWKSAYDDLAEEFALEGGIQYVGVQIDAETNYGRWRNWPNQRWKELFRHFIPQEDIRFLLFGYEKKENFPFPNVIDLRGKTTLFSLLALIKKKCSHLILPDSGILSMVYYLDLPFPITVISLWADPNHGILKQNVSSPNPLLVHRPVIADNKNLSEVSPKEIIPILSKKKVII